MRLNFYIEQTLPETGAEKVPTVTRKILMSRRALAELITTAQEFLDAPEPLDLDR